MYNMPGFSLAGVDTYFKLAKEAGDQEKELFEDIELFEGGTFYEQQIDAIDPDVLYIELMDRYGELLIYGMNPDNFKLASDAFFKKNYKNFAKMQIALQLDFNPIYNYDRYEEWKDTTDDLHTKHITPTGKETLETTQLGKETTETTPSGTQTIKVTNDKDGTTTTSVSAYNSANTWDNKEKVTVNNPETSQETSFDDRKDTTDLSFTDRKTKTETTFVNRDTKDEDTLKDDHRHEGHLYGNIGVTTSTAMIKELLELYDFDIYKYIADKYAKERLLLLY